MKSKAHFQTLRRRGCRKRPHEVKRGDCGLHTQGRNAAEPELIDELKEHVARKLADARAGFCSPPIWPKTRSGKSCAEAQRHRRRQGPAI